MKTHRFLLLHSSWEKHWQTPLAFEHNYELLCVFSWPKTKRDIGVLSVLFIFLLWGIAFPAAVHHCLGEVNIVARRGPDIVALEPAIAPNRSLWMFWRFVDLLWQLLHTARGQSTPLALLIRFKCVNIKPELSYFHISGQKWNWGSCRITIKPLPADVT